MDYNSRASQQFRSQSAHNGTASGRSKAQDKDPDAFMRLSDREIAGCISDTGMHFQPEDLLKPNPQQIQKVFEWFANLLMNITRETVDPAMRAATEDVCGEYGEVVPVDTRNLMGFYVAVRRLLLECGVNDFSFTDLLKPTHDRLVKIFSYIINFVRFRESQTSIIDEHFNKAETTKSRIETLYLENQDMNVRLDELKRQRKTNEARVREKSERNEQLKARLIELKNNQVRTSEHIATVNAEKKRLVADLESKVARTLALRQESAKLKPYVLQSPAALQATLADLGDTLARTKTHTDEYEKRTRALHTSLDTFHLAHGDIAACLRLLDEIAAELRKEDDEVAKAVRRREAVAERGANVRDVERSEHVLQRQLKRWLERTDGLGAVARDRARTAQARMEELREVHRTLAEERAEQGRDVERRRVRVEQMEKKMADLKETIEAEVVAAHDEYLKMDAHIRLYIQEMEGCI